MRMVVCAVGFEPVSTPKFPANREINRVFCDFWAFGGRFPLRSMRSLALSHVTTFATFAKIAMF